jgi:hypothetical protein
MVGIGHVIRCLQSPCADAGQLYAGLTFLLVGFGFLSCLGVTFLIYRWYRDQLRLRSSGTNQNFTITSNPDTYVDATCTAVNFDELQSAKKISFTLMVSNDLDGDIVFARRRVGRMIYSDHPRTLHVRLSGAYVEPFEAGGVIRSGETKDVQIVQHVPDDVARPMLTNYHAGKHQIFNWLDLRVPFQHGGAEYLLRIPARATTVQQSVTNTMARNHPKPVDR